MAKPKKRFLRRTSPEVSDHAVVRYLERVAGVDIEAVRRLILADVVRKAVETFGTGKVQHPDGFRVVFEERNVVTIYAAGHVVQER